MFSYICLIVRKRLWNFCVVTFFVYVQAKSSSLVYTLDINFKGLVDFETPLDGFLLIYSSMIVCGIVVFRWYFQFRLSVVQFLYFPIHLGSLLNLLCTSKPLKLCYFLR